MYTAFAKSQTEIEKKAYFFGGGEASGKKNAESYDASCEQTVSFSGGACCVRNDP